MLTLFNIAHAQYKHVSAVYFRSSLELVTLPPRPRPQVGGRTPFEVCDHILPDGAYKRKQKGKWHFAKWEERSECSQQRSFHG